MGLEIYASLYELGRHPAAGGPLRFHAGATFGQQCFLGFHPATRTAVAAFANRHDRCAVVGSGYALLQELARRPVNSPSQQGTR